MSFGPLTALHCGVILLAFNGLFSKTITLPAFDITVHRSWIAFLVLAMIVIVKKERLLLNRPRDYMTALLLGLALGGHWVTYFHSMQVSSIAVGMIALYTYPVMTALIEPFFEDTSLDRTNLISSVLVLVGVVLIVPEVNLNSNLFQGVLWGILSAILFTLRNLTQRYHFSHYSAPKSLAWQVLVIFAFFMPFLNQPMGLFTATENQWDFWLIVALGVGFTALPHSLLAFALNHIKATSVSLISCLLPVYGSMLGAFALGEIPSWSVVLGGILIVSAAVFETLHTRQARH